VLPDSLSSPTRRLILLGVIVAAGALLWSVVQRRDAPQPVSTGGSFGVCATVKGEAARACYSREVGRELAVVGSAAPEITIGAPAGTSVVTFASVETQQPPPLLCELHERVGVTDAKVPSWLGWTEPLARTPPVS
jgi:hypothetical protein